MTLRGSHLWLQACCDEARVAHGRLREAGGRVLFFGLDAPHGSNSPVQGKQHFLGSPWLCISTHLASAWTAVSRFDELDVSYPHTVVGDFRGLGIYLWWDLCSTCGQFHPCFHR